jgi:pimeloyl-ACP methyl ester carboxylesterase
VAGAVDIAAASGCVITAVILDLIYGAGVAAYALWAAHAAAEGVGLAWLIAVGLLLYFGIPAFLATLWFTLAWTFRTPRPPERRIGLARTVALFWNEMLAILRSASQMAFAWWRLRDPAPGPACAPVLLLHGVLCNAGVWRRWLPRLAARGIGPVYTLSYGPPLASIEAFAEETAAKVDSIIGATGARSVVLVGHSMGGLVARAYLRRYGGRKARCLVTFGTPHHGSVHSWVAPGACLAQMHPGSAWLAELNRDEGAPLPVRTLSLWSWHDSMVAPQTSARLAGAANVELTGIGHNTLLANDEVFSLVAGEIERAAAEADAEAKSAAPASPSATLTNVCPG